MSARYCSGTIVDGGGNKVEDASCGTIPATAGLGTTLAPALADNGCSLCTQTIALLTGSPAIDAAGTCGDGDVCTVDECMESLNICFSAPQDILDLGFQTITEDEEFEASRSISAGSDFVVDSPAIVSFDAPSIILSPSFSVNTGASFKATNLLLCVEQPPWRKVSACRVLRSIPHAIPATPQSVRRTPSAVMLPGRGIIDAWVRCL